MNSKVTKILSAGTARGSCSHRTFVTTRPLQAKKDKETAETCQNVKEAAEAVKEGAREVRKTSEFIRDAASSTAESVAPISFVFVVTKMTKQVTEKVSDAADDITEKAKESVSGAWGSAKTATDMIKDKIIGK